MVRKENPARPLSDRGDEVGVIGGEESRVASDVQEQQVVAVQVAPSAASRPADASRPNQERVDASQNAENKLERVEEPEAAREQRLPANFFDSPGFKAANSSARDAFDSVVLFPGHVFTAPGRYHNIENLDDVYDVVAGQRVPEGLFLIGDIYLVARSLRERRVAAPQSNV